MFLIDTQVNDPFEWVVKNYHIYFTIIGLSNLNISLFEVIILATCETVMVSGGHWEELPHSPLMT